jgi:Zn-dependent protease
MLIAAAGPISNLLLALLVAPLWHYVAGRIAPDVSSVSAGGFLLQFAGSAIAINVMLALFNLVPIPPLDGGNVLSGMLPARMAERYDRIRPYGFILLYGLMFSNVLAMLINPPARLLLGWLT